MADEKVYNTHEHVENADSNSSHKAHSDEQMKDSLAGIAANEQDSDVPKGYWTSSSFLGSCAAIVLLANCLFIGYAMPANILGVINADIGPDSNIYLVSLINTLIKGVGLLLVGSLSDIVGRRWFIIGAQMFGVVGGIIAGTAKNVNQVIGSSVFIGLAGCGQVLYPLLVQEIVPNKYRGWSQTMITVAVLPTLGLGPVVARSLVEYTAEGWRWCFYLNTIVCGVSAILLFFCYHPPGFHDLQRGLTRRQQLKRIDYFGFLLYTGGLVCLLLALSWGGKQYPWKSAQCISTLVIGVLTLIAFVLFEIYMPLSEPLLPMKLFKIRNFWVSVIVGSVGQMSFYALNVLWPTHITALYTKDNMTVGWMSCTTGSALAMGEVLTGPFLKRGGRTKLQMIASMAGLCVFCGVMSLSNEHKQGQAIAITVMIGLFVGWVELIAIVVAGLVIPPENIGSGQAFFASSRAVSGTIATSIYLAIYTNQLSSFTPREVTPAVINAGLPESSISDLFAAIAQATASAIDSVPGMTDAIKAALVAAQKRAYAQSLSTVYLSSLSFGGLALITAFFASDVDKYMTGFVNKTVDQNKTKGEDAVEEKV